MYACVLIRAFPGKVKTTLEATKKVKNVVRAFPVYGRYDIVVFVEGPDFKSLTAASREINTIKGIKRTETAIEG